MSILDTSAAALSKTIDPIAAVIKNPFSTTVNNNGSRPQDFPGGFQITEYINGVPNQDTVIRWIGNQMPFQPFEWGGEQRLVKDYYPGNPEAVVQVLGPKEGPLTIKGRWKDKRFKDPAYYGVAYQYNLALNEMRKRGNLVKFGMTGGSGSWIRYGFLERANFKMNKLSWIDYDIEFFVISETQPKNNYFSAPEKQTPTTVNQNLINAATDFQSNYSSVPATMPLSLAGAINNLISGVAKNVNQVTNFVATTIATAQDVVGSANRAIGLIKNARANISKFSRQIDTLAHSFTNYSSNSSAKSKVTDTFSNVSYIQETMSGTAILSHYLAQMQAQFEAIAKTIPKTRHKVQSGDTLQNLSVKYYGVSDNWSDIYDHNNLHSTVLTPGAILEIPKL